MEIKRVNERETKMYLSSDDGPEKVLIGGTVL